MGRICAPPRDHRPKPGLTKQPAVPTLIDGHTREGGTLVSAPDRCGRPLVPSIYGKNLFCCVGQAATGREVRRAAPNSLYRLSEECLTAPPTHAAVRSARRSDQHLRPDPIGGPLRSHPHVSRCPGGPPTGRGPPPPTSTATNPHPSGGGTGNHRSVYKIGPRAVLYRSTDLPIYRFSPSPNFIENVWNRRNKSRRNDQNFLAE